MMSADKIRTPRGKLITRKQYLAIRNRMNEHYDCVEGCGHCAAWHGGPCASVILAELGWNQETGKFEDDS